MPEYIEREALLERLKFKRNTDRLTNKRYAGLECAIAQVQKAPTADVVEVRHGEWKFNKDGSGTCNQCGFTQKNVWDYDRWQNYCGVCGAKMDGKGE